MARLTPKIVRRIILPASYLAFLAGMFTASAVFYGSRPFDVKTAIISDLLSPDDNPRGFGFAAAGTAAFAILLAPAVVVFFQQLRGQHPRLAMAGFAMFAVAILSAIGLAILAPVTHDYTRLHVLLASTAFFGITTGAWLYLFALRTSRVLLCFQCAVVMLVPVLSYGPIEFNNSYLVTSLAFWEWVLCADCGLALWVLAKELEANAAN